MWEGLRLNIPEPFEKPRSYILQKTPGFMSFHRLAPIIYRLTKKRGHNVNTFKDLFSIYASFPKLGEYFWKRNNLKGAKMYGGGQSAYTRLSIDLRKSLGI
jgi:hypothetical protein